MTAHRQERTDKGKGKRRRRSNKTRNCSGSNRVTRFVGIAVKGTDDNGPLCDLIIALSAGVSCGHTTCSRWWDCTETDACFCHPRASEGSLSSSKLVAGRTPPANASHVGNCTPTSWRCAAQSWTADRHSSLHSSDDDLGHLRMFCPHHLQTIRPTSPVGGIPNSQSTTDTNTPKSYLLCETNSKTQCKECLLFWSRHRLLHLRASLVRK